MTAEQGTSRLPDGSKKGKGKVSIDRSLVYCTVVLSPASAVLTNRDFCLTWLLRTSVSIVIVFVSLRVQVNYYTYKCNHPKGRRLCVEKNIVTSNCDRKLRFPN